MRTKEDILKDARNTSMDQAKGTCLIEVLCDIRDLLATPTVVLKKDDPNEGWVMHSEGTTVRFGERVTRINDEQG